MSDQVAYGFVSCNVAGAVDKSGIGKTRIREAIAKNELAAHYNGNQPVILAEDLRDWVRSLPSEKPSKRGSERGSDR